MPYKFIIICLLILSKYPSFAHKVSGYVYDKNLNQAIPNLTIGTKGTNNKNFTQITGYYELELKTGNHTFFVLKNYVDTIILGNVWILNDTTINWNIDLNSVELKEVLIESKKTDQHHGHILNIEQVKKIPPLLGEYDFIRAATLLPGVSSGGEVSTGLLVRGGTPDQNLMLFDGATVYNNNHLLGFFSNFNPEIIQSFELIKSDYPAEYGGRLSSIVDVKSKTGSLEKYEGSFSAGIINSQITYSGPIVKNKSSFLVSARTANIGLFTVPYFLLTYTPQQPKTYLNYYIYDLNGNAKFNISNNKSLKISLYSGSDYFKYQDAFNAEITKVGINWGNNLASIQYIQSINPKLNFESLLSASYYQINNLTSYVGGPNDTLTEIKLKSSVLDFTSKHVLTYNINETQKLISGLEWNSYVFYPGNYTSKNLNLAFDFVPERNNSYQNHVASAFTQYYKTYNNVNINIGLRASNYIFNQQSYLKIEPRASIKYNFNPQTSLSFAYTKMNQSMHLLSQNNQNLPFDVWLPSHQNIKPQQSNQFALDFNHLSTSKKYHFSFATYYKNSLNLIEFKPEKSLIGTINEDLFDLIEYGGIGRNYGFEFKAEKNTGKIKGFTSYTWAKNQRKFDNLNNGNWFDAMFDKRHSLSINIYYPLTKKWEVSSTFIAHSGLPFTAPTALIEGANGELTMVFESLNNARTPVYHRMDVSFKKSYISKKGRSKELSFGAYNLYHRINPYFVNLSRNPIYASTAQNAPIIAENYSFKAYTLLGFVPFIHYKVNF